LKLVDISETEKRKCLKDITYDLKQIIRTRMPEICIAASMNLRRVAGL
jgi:hypothetical protein